MEKCHVVVLCIFVTSLFLAVTLVDSLAGCDEAICASLVSKCLLLKSCECDMTDKLNCTCCKDCHRCLSRLYTECCACVGMCPVRTAEDSWKKTSSVELLADPMPQLFEVLTEEQDPTLRWTTHTYPAHLDLVYFQPENSPLQYGLETDEATNNPGEESSESERHIRHGRHRFIIDPDTAAMNCTVAYMSQCMSLNKCKVACQSMGASRYRWFHADGCCECIGSTCLDYGKGEALCLRCPLPEDEEEDQDDSSYYYDPHEEDKYQEDGNSVVEEEELDDVGGVADEEAELDDIDDVDVDTS